MLLMSFGRLLLDMLLVCLICIFTDLMRSTALIKLIMSLLLLLIMMALLLMLMYLSQMLRGIDL